MRCVAFRKRLTIIIQYRRKQFMVNKESIQRSGILTDKSLSFLSFKREFLEKSKYFQSNKIRNYFNVSDNDWNSWKYLNDFLLSFQNHYLYIANVLLLSFFAQAIPSYL